MPPGIFVRFLATNWCSLVDSGGCRWGKFSALWSRRGGGGGRAILSNKYIGLNEVLNPTVTILYLVFDCRQLNVVFKV